MESRPTAPKRAAVIDEYGELARRVLNFKPTAQRKLELEKEIASWYDNELPEAEFVAEGRIYTVQISAKGLKREITDMAKLFGILGKTRFLELCSVAVGAIDREVPIDKHPTFLAQSRAGRRGVEAAVKDTAASGRRLAA